MTGPTTATRRAWTDDLPLRVATLVTLVSAAFALVAAGLIPPAVCLLTVVLILVVGLLVPRRMPSLTSDSPQRTGLALATVGLLIAATAGSGPGALFAGDLTGPLGAAVAELGLPGGVPIGLLAALAAGALVAVTLELADRRGVQSALVLGTAVLGLASVAAPGTHLVPALVLGWPAAMFALTRLTANGPAAVRSRPVGTGLRPREPVPDPRPPRMHPAPATESQAVRVVLRWQVVPVLTVITASLVVLTLAVVSGVATIGERAGNFGAASGLTGATGGRSSSDYLGGEMDLSARGALRQDPILEVTDDSPRLWRAGTLDTYDGRGWLATDAPAGLPSVTAGADGTVQLLDPAAAGTRNPRSDQVRPVRAGATQVLAPGRLLSLSAARLQAGGKVYVSAGDRVTMAGGTGAGDYRVRADELPTVDDPDAATRLAAPAAEPADPESEVLDPRWTALPASVPERVRELGRSLVAAAPSRLAAVRAIEADLAARMTYSLDSPVPPPGADAVDDVLFVSHSGFCEQFATAEVVLLRAAGVPARVAVGFTGGEPGDDGFRTVRRSDAHAWVEVWFEGVGWVTSDPTPAAVVTEAWWHPIRDALGSLLAGPVTWFAIGLVLLLLVAGAAVVLRRRWSSVPAGTTGRAMDPELAAAFAQLEAELRAQGRPRAPNETVAALSRRLAATWSAGDLGHAAGDPGPPRREPTPDLWDAFGVLERALYASEPPTRAESLVAARTLARGPGPKPP